MGYYSAIKKNEIMPFEATWRDLEMIILSEVNQTKKDKYHMICLVLTDDHMPMYIFCLSPAQALASISPKMPYALPSVGWTF